METIPIECWWYWDPVIEDWKVDGTNDFYTEKATPKMIDLKPTYKGEWGDKSASRTFYILDNPRVPYVPGDENIY